MSSDGDLDWIPEAGVHLTRAELVDVFVALRALIDGTGSDEPNRSHIVSVAYVLASAIERLGGTG